jgi:3-deoxy-D-manno-octulosonate 8-phosphate phosphatase (KDO 8-P phosphatase)
MHKNSINTVIIDVDGTLTDGNIIVSSRGESLLLFNIRDGLGIKLAYLNSVRIIVLSGSSCKAINKRMTSLGLDTKNINLGVQDKAIFVSNLIKEKVIDKNFTLYIGDDINDLEAMQLVKYKSCPLNAHDRVLETVNYISKFNGGFGAVRDILEFYFPDLF